MSWILVWFLAGVVIILTRSHHKQDNDIDKLRDLNQKLHHHNTRLFGTITAMVRDEQDPNEPCGFCAGTGDVVANAGVMPCPLCRPEEFAS